MNVRLTTEQQSQLDLLSLYAGKTVEQVLTETAKYLLDRDVQFWQMVQRGGAPTDFQGFLENDEMDARLARVLGR